MTQRWTTFKIGLFVLLGVGIAIAGAVAVGLFSQLRRTTRFETYTIGDIDGLAVGSPVKLKGVRVGEVAEVTFSWVAYPGANPPAVVVRFDVDPGALPPMQSGEGVRVGVHEGLRAMVETQGITGLAVLSLDVVSGPERPPPLVYTWKPAYPVVPSAPSQLSELLSSAQTVLRKLQRLDVERIQEGIDRTLRSADETLQQLRGLDAAGLSRDLASAAVSARQATAEVRALAQDARTKLDRVPAERLAREAEGALAALRASTERLDRLADHFGDVDVQEVNATVKSARRVARDLDETLAQLRRYPSGFLFGKAPPPASAVEAER